MSRLRLRRFAALLCAGIAGVYVLIGTEVVTVSRPTDAEVDIGVFGFGAAAIFLVGLVLLLRTDRRVVWGLGAALQLMIAAMYVGVSSDRDPAFEAWGLGLRVPQLILFGILVYLAVRPSTAEREAAVDPDVVADFLAQRRLAVVGASDEAGNFGRTIYGELRDHGYEVVAVHPTAATVMDDVAYRSLAEVPGTLDGVVVMVPKDAAVAVVREALDHAVPRIWLFKGAGPGAASLEAIELARAGGATVVPGACPLMFLTPVAAIHRIHRGVRHLNGSLARSA
jgi:uncharacterized protein